MLQILFVLVLMCVADDSCSQHTAIYNAHGKLNDGNFYFVEKTFNYGNEFNPCLVMDPNNALFRNYMSNNLPCAGTWCSNVGNNKNGWNCKMSNRDCYEVEHIIPKANSIKELEGCDTNIFGNLIMAYGKWNAALGNGFLCEKEEIYGSLIYNKAYNTVLNCCKTQNIQSYFIWWLFFGLIILIISLGGSYLLIMHLKKQRDNAELSQYQDPRMDEL